MACRMEAKEDLSKEDKDLFGNDGNGESSNESEDDCSEDDDSPNEGIDAELEDSNQKEDSQCNELVVATLMFLMFWQVLHHVSDRALTIILKMIKCFLWALAAVLNVDSLRTVSKMFPSCLQSLRKRLNLNRDDFAAKVVCPKCNCIYDLNDCVTRKATGLESKRCSFIKWPNHPWPSVQNKICGTVLLKKIRGKNGPIFRPKRVYALRSIQQSLEEILKRPGGLNLCEKWRDRSDFMPDDLMGDVYDGKIWNEFQYVDGTPFLAAPNNIALMMNVDWFQPFKHVPHSVGAIYFVIQNLPREERFKTENLILAGLIPGPKEPSLNINTFLEPLVDELEELWKGVEMKLSSFTPCTTTIRAALLCLACDIPAARKVGGFVGHGAKRGCSKCLKTFPTKTFGEKIDFSGFDRENWCKRNKEIHKEKALLAKRSRSETEKQKVESEHGCRYSELNRLNYYDPIRFCVIDPMHNLLLGTAKRMIDVWIRHDVLHKIDFTKIQTIIENTVVPRDIGRIPGKVENGFSGFTADQWRNWTIIFSPIALKDILPSEHYSCWMKFVKVCKILCCRTITKQECTHADELLLNFCKDIESLYGKEEITPNMHLHCHVVSCLEDFGPVYSFWCFSFERYNGILGNYITNSHCITAQLMRQFLQQRQINDKQKNAMFNEYYSDLIGNGEVLCGSLKECYTDGQLFINAMRQAKCLPQELEMKLTVSNKVEMLHPVKTKYFDSADIQNLTGMYKIVFQGWKVITCYMTFKRHCSMIVFGDYVNTTKSPRTERSSYILAHWYGINGTIGHQTEMRPGQLEFIANHKVVIENIITQERKTIISNIAKVKWFKSIEQRHHLGEFVTVWRNDFEQEGPASFIPVTRIHSSFSPYFGPVDVGLGLENNLMIATGLERKCAM